MRMDYVMDEKELKNSENICSGCGFHPIGGACLMWKYINKEICEQFRKEIDEVPIRTYQSPSPEFTCVVRVLCGFDYSVDPKIIPTGTYYKYSKITSMLINGLFMIKSKQSITKEEYEDFIKIKKFGHPAKACKISEEMRLAIKKRGKELGIDFSLFPTYEELKKEIENQNK